MLALIHRFTCAFLFIASCILIHILPLRGIAAQSSNGLIRQIEAVSPTRALIDLDDQWEYSNDDSEWSFLSIPCSLENQGKFYLRKKFSLSQQQSSNFSWEFIGLGINYQCDIYVNDQFLTHHVGGYTTCEFLIPEYMLHQGENSIRLNGSNELSAHETLPIIPDPYAPRNYGGIYRDIALVGLPPLWINDVTVQGGTVSGNISLRVSLNAGKLTHSGLPDSVIHSSSGSQLAISVRTDIYENNNTQPVVSTPEYQATMEESRSLQINISSIIPSPKLWSPASPTLYKARCTIWTKGTLIDEYNIHFGLRTFTNNGDIFSLNDLPFEIKGIVYEDDIQKEKNAIRYSSYEQDVQLIKTLGANAIRLDHPADPTLLTLCDEYGLLVFEQISVRDVPATILQSPNFISLAKNSLQQMITRDFNHPSIVAWGVASFADVARGSLYFEQLGTFSRTLDNRPTYCSIWDYAATCKGVNFCFVDEFGQETSEFQMQLHNWKLHNPTTPLVVSTYGKSIKPDDHNGYNDPLSVESQSKYIVACYNAMQKEHAAGGFIMSFTDWSSNRPSIVSIETNPYMHYTGLISYGRDERRLTFDVAKALFTGDKIPMIIVGEDTESAPVIYIIIGLIFLLMLVYLANNSRRFRENFSRAIFRPFNFYADIRDQRILSTMQTTILGVITAGTYAIFLSSIFFYIRTNWFFDHILNILIPWNGLKYETAQLIWHPIECVAIFSLIFFTLQIIISGIIRFWAIFVRSRIFFSDVYSIVLWAGLPSMILIPLCMILYRVIMIPQYVFITSLLSVFTVFWILFRVLRGTAVVFDVPFRNVLATAIGILAVVSAAIVYYYDTNYAAIPELTMIYRQLFT